MIHRAIRILLLVSICLMPVLAHAQNWQGATYDAVVTHVVDGDTIQVKIGDHFETVRYIGINTPEIHHPTRGREPYGAEAARANAALVAGQPVRLMLDVQPRDRFGRLLAYVWVNGQFVNGELVRRGYAEAATFPPNVRYYATFIELQRQARAGQVGLWGDPDAVAAYQARPSGVVGRKTTNVYLHHADPIVRMRDPAELVYFDSEAEARAAGYTRSYDFQRFALEEHQARHGGSVPYHAATVTGPSTFRSDSAPTTYSAPLSSGSGSPSSGSASTGGSVYVHGYTKQDGTVVAPYMRSAPGRGGRR